MTIEKLQDAQLKAFPDSIFVSITEFIRLTEKHLGYANAYDRKKHIEDIAFREECVAYIIPRKGKNERPYLGIRTGEYAGDYHSFS
jgi:hypothetical protein